MQKEEIFLKNFTFWQELYSKYDYAFMNFQDFKNYINDFLNQFNLENKKYIYKEANKYIINYIRKNLENNDIHILLNYITSNINIDNNPYEELLKIINWLRKFNYIPTSNIIIKLLEECKIFNFLMTKIFDNDLKKVGKEYDDEIFMLFLEIYCALNNTTIDQKEYVEIFEDLNSTNERDSFFDDKLAMPVGVQAFLSEIRSMNLSVLTKEEEQNLMVKIKKGDKKAYQYFYEHNLRLVISIAKKYVNKGVPFEDLIQEGCIGLMNAIEHFEVEKGYKFSTYATCYIKQSVMLSLVKYGRTIKIPQPKSSELFRYYQKILDLEKQYGHELSDQEIADNLQIPFEEVQTNNNLLKGCLSLNQCMSNLDEFELGNSIRDNIDIENDFLISDLGNEIKKLFKEAGLTEKEIFVLKHRWGLDNVRKKTLIELGNYFGVTKEYINIIENKAINKLRKSPFLVNFIYYIDYPDKAFKNIGNLVSYQAIHKKSKFNKNGINTINIKKKNNIYNLTFNEKKYTKEEIDLAISFLDDLDKEILQLFYDLHVMSPTTISDADLNKYRDVLYERVIPNLAKNLEDINSKKLSRK